MKRRYKKFNNAGKVLGKHTEDKCQNRYRYAQYCKLVGKVLLAFLCGLFVAYIFKL